jgi:hypothetical protein
MQTLLNAQIKDYVTAVPEIVLASQDTKVLLVNVLHAKMTAVVMEFASRTSTSPLMLLLMIQT